jgi:predicted transcriptional regulator
MSGQVADTSLEAYRTRVLPCLAESQATVYKAILDATQNGYDVTDKEVSRILHWEINCVVPRRVELAEMGLIVRVQRRRCGVTGNNAYAWKVKL